MTEKQGNAAQPEQQGSSVSNITAIAQLNAPDKAKNLNLLSNALNPSPAPASVQKVVVKHAQVVSKVVSRKVSDPTKIIPARPAHEVQNTAVNISSVDTLLNNPAPRPKSVDILIIPPKPQNPVLNPPPINSVSALLQNSPPKPIQSIIVPQHSVYNVTEKKPIISDMESLLQHPMPQPPLTITQVSSTVPVTKSVGPSVIFRNVAPKQVVPPPPVVHEVKPAAIYPALPTASEIQLLIDAIDVEIEELHAKMKSLEDERTLGMIEMPDLNERGENVKILDFHNIIYTQSAAEAVIAASQSIAKQSHEKNKMPTQSDKYTHITQLPLFMDEMQHEDSNTETMLHVLCQKVSKVDLKARQLSLEYAERRKMWEESNDLLDAYHKDIRASIDEWPPEFALSIIKPTDHTATRFCGKDQIMYLDDEEKEAYLYYDENSYVEDPVKEHEIYKKRNPWSDTEKQIFLDKYYQHPRDFKKIAQALPLKTIKEVIEYYNIYRIKLNLKQADVAGRRRGRKRILVE